jgi:hypothetical protein
MVLKPYPQPGGAEPGRSLHWHDDQIDIHLPECL